MKCPDCRSEWKVTNGSWDYAPEAGLSPDDYRVVLNGVDVYSCECGESAAIPVMEELHALIAIHLLTHADPLKPSGIRYLRKYAGLTQAEFADLVGSESANVVCMWESATTNERLPGKTAEFALRFMVVKHLRTIDRFAKYIDADAVVEMVDHAGFSEPINRRSEIEIPEAFIVAAIEQARSGAAAH